MGRGYSGNHPRFSHRQDERYDAKEAYNKDLTASARLHYLENDRHDHESPAHSHCSPMHRHNDRHIMREAKKIARQNEGDVQDIYYELKSQVASDERSGRKPKRDERSGEIRNQMLDEMIDDRPDSPMNNIDLKKAAKKIRTGALKPVFDAAEKYEDWGIKQADKLSRKIGLGPIKDTRNKKSKKNTSPFRACAKSEGGKGCIQQMGGAWRVISNKTDKPWPAKYASKSKAEAALRGYHAG